MGKRLIFIKVLTVLGTISIWLPILVPIVFSVIALFAARGFLLDYLMPAELFPLAIFGAGLLFCAALIRRSHMKLIIICITVAAGSLVLGQVFAVVTGLASGRIKPEGLPWILVIFSLALYTAALIGVGVSGLLLLRNLFFGPLNKKNK